MKFFIASSWTNGVAVNTLRDNLMVLGHEVVYPGKEADNLFAAGADWRSRIELKKIFEQEVTKIEEADQVIMLLPAGRASHISVGIAYGFGKHLTLIGQPEKIEGHYFMFDKDYKTIDEYIAALRAH